MADTNANDSILKFPYASAVGRLQNYEYYDKLLMGEHFAAFNIKIDNEQYSKDYAKMRYIKVNFAGLISKVIADFLFSEPIKIKAEDGDQEFVNALVHENNLDTLLYESALGNSAIGDALLKVRKGKRNASDKEETIIIEPVTPRIYFPMLNQFNVNAKPDSEELAWVFTKDGVSYLRKEIHTAGKVVNEVWKMDGDTITSKEAISILGIDGLKDEVETGVDRSLLIHVPNWRAGNRYFGISDYYDLDTLFYAINNRMSKIDNILDKHSDPILAIPEGLLDEDGNVERAKLGMVEIPDGINGSKSKPEYIVWNANLESAFKEVESLVEFMFMISETSPDILGMGKGVNDSGRALKLKILRTIAKAARKKLYYDHAIKEAIYIAQLLAKSQNVKVGGVALTKEAVIPEIVWNDGIPTDEGEEIDNQTKRLDAELTTRKDAIMAIDGVDEDIAEKMVEDIDEEKKVAMPSPTFTKNPFMAQNMNDKNKNDAGVGGTNDGGGSGKPGDGGEGGNGDQ